MESEQVNSPTEKLYDIVSKHNINLHLYSDTLNYAVLDINARITMLENMKKKDEQLLKEVKEVDEASFKIYSRYICERNEKDFHAAISKCSHVLNCFMKLVEELNQINPNVDSDGPSI